MKLERLIQLASDSADWRHKQKLDEHCRDNFPKLLAELKRMVVYYASGETRPEALGKIRDAVAAIKEAEKVK